MIATHQGQGVLDLPEPIGKQYEWLDADVPNKVMRVGRRGSKTRFAFVAALMGHGPGWEDGTPKFPGILQGTAEQPKDVVWICPTYTNLSTVLWREEIVPRMGHLPWVDLNKSLHDVNIPGLGSLMLRSGDREAINSVRGVGKRLAGVIVDEAAHMDLRGALLDVIMPACLDNDAWLILMSTTNAGQDGGYDDTGAPQVPSYFNIVCKETQTGKRDPSLWREFTGTAYDNPVLARAAIDALVAEYPPDSPKLRQEVFAELLESGVGLALPGLRESVHMVPAFTPPAHWNHFAAFDWGFHHPWVFGLYCVDEDGHVYKRDTISGRLDLPPAIHMAVKALGGPRATPVFGGPDAWRTRVSSKGRVQGEFEGPTIAEQLQRLGWVLLPAADARVAGLNNVRLYTHVPPDSPDAKPRFQWMDTPGNRACIAQMQRIQLDPDNPEDALKVNADAAGRGGDDFYDETRYGLMSRPIVARGLPVERREGEARRYDYAGRKVEVRPTAQDEFAKLMKQGQPSSPSHGRYSVPRRGR